MKTQVTMDDVARAARCSRAAVSMALRGDPSIPAKTQERIKSIALQLEYRTNPMVAALMSLNRRRRPISSVSPVIAYLTSHASDDPWRANAAYVEMFNGAIKRARDIGYSIEEFKLAAVGMASRRMREILLTRAVRGLIVAPLPHRLVELELDISSFAVVGLGLSVHKPVIERVANDHFQSAFLAVDRCVRLGYSRIGLALNVEMSERLEHRWLAGYQFSVRFHGLAEIPPLMPGQPEGFREALPKWIRQNRPDVVILDHSPSEQLSLVPPDVGVVSLGVDRPISGVSGIYQNFGLLGGSAVEHIVAKLHANRFGVLDDPELHLIAGVWVQGQTTPGPKRRRPLIC